ncbi:MCE family protein [Pseudonocardia spinosispora]|uniref:MCE family protein n=1 Tax=Pseudonocardia spinosispora TaxID=103441 RepID=UPI000425317C|nr:MlaD family protein [Pseudonocardia spinosispora]
MARRDNALAVTAPLIKTVAFAVLGTLILAVLWVQFGQIRFDRQKSYSAILQSASGIRPASTVTANGVAVGRIDDVELYDNSQARVHFTIDATVPLTTTTLARVRWKNLTGDQYLDLSPGAPGAPPLPDDATIPVNRTRPALDIDQLLNGFDPLFQGLQPAQVNQLSGELVSVLQGQGGTIESVFAHAASFTGSLAAQDKLIGSVIGNLNTVVGNLDAHSAQLSDTLLAAQQLVSKLNDHRQELVTGLDRTAHLADQVGDVAAALRSGHDTLTQLGRASQAVNDYGGELDRVLGLLPGMYLRLGRLTSGGAAYNVNVCQLRLRLSGPDGKPYYSPWFGPSDNSPRCSRDNVAPLQGEEPTNVHGPELPPERYDGQAVASSAPHIGYVQPHDTNPQPGVHDK